ncbi:unnamed protein product [Kuraishia capsulata CBS 1993]|uniref:Uncharacterized protein n=1 Tax=Kuraishia capsulata CBS 1993 TaxID=1382522 RepID=W6MRV7_9ASCO|nr:uncharacterized protein KUCA_T00005479001 [Kuraishia capsulata CBS 1993]CDK29491.1 unnamed protein product [Kuraishia capsulata CBS 1993]
MSSPSSLLSTPLVEALQDTDDPPSETPLPEEDVEDINVSEKRANPESETLPAAKRKAKTTKIPSDILQKRREGRARAMASLQNKLNELGIKRTDVENDLVFSSIPTIPLINQKNYYTDYLKKDDQFKMTRKLKNLSSIKEKLTSPDVEAEDEQEGDDDEKSQTIVLHPGSSTIRVGLASDVDPHLVPNLIAYQKKSETSQTFERDPKREVVNGDITVDDPDFTKTGKIITSNFKERMKYYKRRILPNSQDTCYNFNKRQQPEIIPEHNDVHRIDYTNPDAKFIVGEEVLKLKDESNWVIRSPFDSGKFHDLSSFYSSFQEILADVENMLSSIITDILEIDPKKISNYNCVLVIPNLFDKTYVETMCFLLLNSLKIGNISVIQEGISATFGSGISSGCIVDIGAATTKICCVDEGMILPNSQVELSYGGNDITRALVKMLLNNQFPYGDIDLNDLSDWNLANELKEKYSTFQDADIAVQMYGFVSRKANQPSKKYEYKLFEELMIPAMGLFYPDFFKDGSDQRRVLGKKSSAQKEVDVLNSSRVLPKHSDYVSGTYDNPVSKLQQFEQLGKLITLMEDDAVLKTLKNIDDENFQVSDDASDEKLNYTPLDLAIIESITCASFNDKNRMKRLYESVLLVGGSSLFNGLDLILIDRIHIWRSKLLSSNLLDDIVKQYEDEVTPAVQNMLINSTAVPIEILSSSKEVNPSSMIWKGGCVYSRLKIINELWISLDDWDMLGSRCLNQTCLFNY